MWVSEARAGIDGRGRWDSGFLELDVGGKKQELGWHQELAE